MAPKQNQKKGKACRELKKEKEKRVKPVDRKLRLHDESEEDDEDPSLRLLRRKAKRQASTAVVEIPSSRSQQEVEVSRVKPSPLAPVLYSRRNNHRVPEPDCQILENTNINSFSSSYKKVRLNSASPQDGEKAHQAIPEKRDANFERGTASSCVELPIAEHCCKTVVSETSSLVVINQAQYEVPLSVEYPEMVPNQRIEAAWETLKPFGASRDEVKSILKHLMELYDNNWVFIKGESYKVLRDYFLQETKEKEVNSVKGQNQLQKLESSSKTQNLRHGECHALPVNGSRDEVPLAVIHPAFGSSNRSYSDTNNQKGFGVVETRPPRVNDSLSKASQFDIASSSEGDVKISLVCNSPRSNFQFPCFDKVLKTVEAIRIKPDTTTVPILDMKLMEEICECVLALGTGSAYGKKPSTQENGNISFGIVPNLSRGSMIIHNLIEVLPSVPKGVTLNSLSDLHYVNGTNIKDVIIREDFHDVKSRDYVDDITRGEERVKISLVNGCSDERLVLPNFHYVRENTVYRSADVSFSLVHILDEDCCSDCFGDCLSSGRSCACAGGTGGGFAYTSSDILNEQFVEECIAMNQEKIKERDLSSPCKIHSLTKFIKECWVKCGCTKKCGNRVVQRGITAKLQVFATSRTKGWSLRTLEDLPKGAFVCEYAGEVLTKSELYDRRIVKNAYSVLLGASWGSDDVLMDEHALRLDSTEFGNVARFINHRCFDATLIAIPVEIESPDRRYYHLGLFATRKIKAMEELTWDYGVSFDEFKCLCGSAHCRGSKV